MPGPTTHEMAPPTAQLTADTPQTSVFTTIGVVHPTVTSHTRNYEELHRK